MRAKGNHKYSEVLSRTTNGGIKGKKIGIPRYLSIIPQF